MDFKKIIYPFVWYEDELEVGIIMEFNSYKKNIFHTREGASMKRADISGGTGYAWTALDAAVYYEISF